MASAGPAHERRGAGDVGPPGGRDGPTTGWASGRRKAELGPWKKTGRRKTEEEELWACVPTRPTREEDAGPRDGKRKAGLQARLKTKEIFQFPNLVLFPKFKWKPNQIQMGFQIYFFNTSKNEEFW